MPSGNVFNHISLIIEHRYFCSCGDKEPSLNRAAITERNPQSGICTDQAFFTSVGPSDITVMTDINRYLDFVLKLFFAFGIAFEIPIAAVILIITGVTTPEKLGKKRPWIIVGCFIAGMLLTPPDVISQSLLALPMWFLFELGIIFGRLFHRRLGNGDAGAAE